MNWLDLLSPVVEHKDRRSPVYLRITDCIRRCISEGGVSPNDRLPTDRELSKQLNVDRSTIARAYNQLESEGLVRSHVGRGTFVAEYPATSFGSSTNKTIGTVRVSGSGVNSSLGNAPAAESSTDMKFYPAGRSTENRPDRIVWADKFSRASETVSAIANRQPMTSGGPDCISFASALPTQEFFPQKDFQEIVSELLGGADSAEMFSYTQPEGHPGLRREVLAYLSRLGINAKEENLLILSGSQQGIDVVARTMLNQDDVVLLEDPTYFWATCNFAFTGARCVPLATDVDGLRLDAFENAARSLNAKLLYIIPSFQNPTGATLPLERRKRLLELARQYQIPILEDNFVGDLSYTQPVPTLYSLDAGKDTVIHQGTFSKALCPGLRLGWLVAPEQVMTRLRLAKRTSDLSTNTLSQVILAEYLRRGLYEDRLATVRRAYEDRLDAMCKHLTEMASQWLSWQKPDGGMFVWAKLPPGYSALELLTLSEREGVLFSPGDVFETPGARSEYIRLSFIQHNEDQIKEGVTRLTKALKSYSTNRKKLQRSDGSYKIAEANYI